MDSSPVPELSLTMLNSLTKTKQEEKSTRTVTSVPRPVNLERPRKLSLVRLTAKPEFLLDPATCEYIAYTNICEKLLEGMEYSSCLPLWERRAEE